MRILSRGWNDWTISKEYAIWDCSKMLVDHTTFRFIWPLFLYKSCDSTNSIC